MSRRLAYTAALVAALLVPAAPASADTTLGLTAKPGGTGNGSCTSSQILAQITDDPSSPYIVPAGGGFVTQWQTETASDTPGSTLTFAVLHPTGPGTYKVLEADSRTIATPLPASGTASFTLTTPVAVTMPLLSHANLLPARVKGAAKARVISIIPTIVPRPKTKR